MNENTDVEFSRQVATSKLLADQADGDVEHFFELPVLLTGDPVFLRTENGRAIFVNSALLLIRMTKALVVEVLENSALADEVNSTLSHATKHSSRIITEQVDRTTFNAILFVGAEVNSNLPWTAINSHGWLARVSSHGNLSNITDQSNPIGALAAACFGVSEIFKRLLKVRPERGELHDRFVFSFYSYNIEPSPGPQLRALKLGRSLLVGAGAIGNGVCRLLLQMPISGMLTIIDPQSLAEENLGTCLLASRNAIGTPKAKVLADFFQGDLKADGLEMDVESFMNSGFGKPEFPDIVMTALDNIDARRDTQTIWPDLIIDGAIGALSCEVTLHPWGPDLSCLMCDFERPVQTASKLQSEWTGLSESRLRNLLDIITEQDVLNAPTDKKELLKKYTGKQICSLLSAEEIEKISQEKHKPGFQPSVPFVACLSACMIVAELYRALSKDEPALETGFQFDVLVGPQNGIRKAHSRKPYCLCVTLKSDIETLRSQRRSV